MSSASYAAWAKFDVEKELARADEREQREAQHKQQRTHLRAKESVESSATQAAQQSADVLAAQAAVAALKAKKRAHKGRAETKQSDEAVADEAEKAARLQTQAALFAQKHELLQQVLENRRLGDRALAGGKKEARQLFERALAASKTLEGLAPELLKADEEQVNNGLSKEPPAETSSQQDKSQGQDTREHGSDEAHSCGENCSRGEKKAAKKPDESLPKANDLLAIIKMFYKDVYVGIGTCDLEEGKLAAATEAFKEVLLRDDAHLNAWLKRGEAFERMDAPLLAMLHFNRITTLDPDHETGKESLERVKAKLLTEGDASSDRNTIASAVSACTEGRTFREVLEQTQRVIEEANVLAVESFFDYSTTKYQVVLGCMEVLRARPEFSATNEVAVSPVLRELEISCHLNIASGCLEMQRNYTKGLSHCEQALRLDSSRVMAQFRMGQLFHALHSYEKALRCFEMANTLVPAVASGQAESHKQMLSTIAKEVDKCEFDRNQYDTEYLRSLAAK
ncbi:Receptor expression-enhancing protein 5 [Phytophthora pseudosyringae]|uniref:Receptor expression-enhancing protein 5 n=1 Tax=Phytophthora pseudosyringae TaxID=221518 RepID=A0A8T1W3Y2_9STRA|nr:Receptor expression-enhancing protein 5 [Phytophthora pseudosyringae]